jgi:predicted  nucleic acid-binding Zn-ribbon protein
MGKRTSDNDEESSSLFKSARSIGKDLLPWVMAAGQLIYGYGVKQSTTDRVQEKVEENKLAIQDVRTQLTDVRTQLSQVAKTQEGYNAKVEVLLTGFFKERR